MSDPRRYNNGNTNNGNDAFTGNGYGSPVTFQTGLPPPPVPPPGAFLHQYQQYQQHIPFTPQSQTAPAYYQYASPIYQDPHMMQFYQQQYVPPPQHQHPLPPQAYYAPPIQPQPPKKKIQFKNQQFVPQKDHNQYLPENKSNNFKYSSQPPLQFTADPLNNIESPSVSSMGQASPAQTISSPPSSTKSSTPKLAQQQQSASSASASITPSTTSSSTSTSIEETQEIEVNENGNGTRPAMGFTVDSIAGIVKPPFFFGTTKTQLTSQKNKFKAIREEKKQLEEQQEKNLIQKNTVEATTKEKEAEVSPSTPKPTVAVAQWSFIAQQGAKKNPPKSTTSTSATTTAVSSPITKKEPELKYVPSVSNVLEPLGVVLLRSMFDKNFQKAFINNNKVPKIVPRGLVNTGNICFMSSILQLLLYCQPFYQTLNIISTKTIQSLNKSASSSTPLIDSIIDLYKNFNVKLDDDKPNQDFGDSFIPEQFYKEISQHSRFSHLQWGQQEDAEEFFGYLLDGLHEEFIASVKNLKDNDVKILLDSITSEEVKILIKQSLEKFSNEEDFNSKNENNSTSISNGTNSLINDDGWHEVGNNKKKISAKRTVEVKPSPIRQLFGGQFRSVLDVPKQRESQSITLDPFQQVQLDISDDNINTLEDAFKHLSQIEELQYKSDDGSDVIAKKQTFIDKLPEVLIVHLKRFSFVNKTQKDDHQKSSYLNSHSGRIEKISKKIKYDHDFTIPIDCISSTTRKFNPSLNYKLIGVVYHHGMSSEGGHYTVDVLRKGLGQWIRIDDTKITKLEPEDVLSFDNNINNVKTAYILMYQKN